MLLWLCEALPAPVLMTLGATCAWMQSRMKHDHFGCAPQPCDLRNSQQEMDRCGIKEAEGISRTSLQYMLRTILSRVFISRGNQPTILQRFLELLRNACKGDGLSLILLCFYCIDCACLRGVGGHHLIMFMHNLAVADKFQHKRYLRHPQ